MRPDLGGPAAGGRPAAPGTSLERKLPLLISALLLVVIVVYAWASYDEVRDAAVTNATERLRIVARALAGITQTGGGTRQATLRALAADPAVVAGARGGDTAAAAAALRAATRARDTLHATWELWSADGARRVAVGESSSPLDVGQLRRVVPELLRGDSVRQSPLYAAGGRAYTWMAVPVRDGDTTVGLVAERRRTGNQARMAQLIRELMGQEVTVYFTSRGSDVWVGLDGRATDPGFALPASDSVGSFAARTPAGARVYGGRAGIPGTPHVIVLTLGEAAVRERPRTFLRRLAASGVVICLVGWVGAWLLSRHVTRPLRALTVAAEAVARGDYRQRVSVDQHDELGRLAATFNAMAARIGESHAELARRVDESTALALALERRNEDLRAAQDATLRAVRRTQRLQTVTAALASALEFDRVVAVILRAGREAADAASCDVFIVNTEHTALTLVRSESAAPAFPSPAHALAIDAADPVAQAARTGEAVYPAAHAGAGADAAAQVALPLVARGRAIGALRLRYAPPPAFDAETRAFLGAHAQQCAQALDRALLYDAAIHARNAAEQARHAAQAANKAKSAFLAMMSHELRTPLNAIGGYTELLELGIRGPVSDAQREDLVRIRRNQQHLLSIINDILNLTRIEAGQVAIRPEDVRVADVVGELEALAGPQLASKGLRYQVVACDRELVVRADPEKLSQVLLNLLSNAVRFTDAGGSVTVSCDADADTVYLRVADTGIGIPADKREVIFEPFIQVDAGLTRRTGGTGLGLSISRDLMAAMGGRITVESEVGRGSTFTLALPRANGVLAGARGEAPARGTA